MVTFLLGIFFGGIRLKSLMEMGLAKVLRWAPCIVMSPFPSGILDRREQALCADLTKLQRQVFLHRLRCRVRRACGRFFRAADVATFTHGSALNIGVISDFICDCLVSPCSSPQSSVDTCQSASTAAKALTGQGLPIHSIRPWLIRGFLCMRTPSWTGQRREKPVFKVRRCR